MDLSRRIALHEAAHVVVALKLRQPFGSVTIVAEGKTAGQVKPSAGALSIGDWLGVAGLGNKRDTIAVHLAGPHVDRLAGKEWNPAHSDFTRAMRVLLDMTSGNEPAATMLFEELYQATAAIVDEYWSDVESLADALQEHKTLTARQIRQALPHLAYRNRAEQLIDAM